MSDIVDQYTDMMGEEEQVITRPIIRVNSDGDIISSEIVGTTSLTINANTMSQGVISIPDSYMTASAISIYNPVEEIGDRINEQYMRIMERLDRIDMRLRLLEENNE